MIGLSPPFSTSVMVPSNRQILQYHHVFGRVVFGTHQHIHRQLFAAEADHHQLPAEIGMMRDIAQARMGTLASGALMATPQP